MINRKFHTDLKTFTITSVPFYDEYKQCYKNILMVNFDPPGPIKTLVRRLKLPRLSPFQREGPCNSISQCGLALRSLHGIINNLNPHQYTGCCKINSGCDLMTPDEIPDLITFLLGNGYQIETQITNMLNQSEIKFSYMR
jgi:hypothetical protein